MLTTPLHIPTPLLQSRTLSLLSGKNIWLKMDALQPPGSFKIRGMGLACQEYARRGARRFISSSGGNAGIAVAYAGRLLSIPVTVVVPQTTTARAQALIGEQGAEVIVHGASWTEANALAQTMIGAEDAFLHPFDDPLLWQGHGSMIDEVAAENLRPDLVVVSAGGGGLYCGVVEGLRRNGMADVPVLVSETAGADSFAQSVHAGQAVTLPAITSIATSLGARRVCDTALAYAASHPTFNTVVTDQAAVAACQRFIDDHRVLVEPACGAALAPVYQRAAVMSGYENVLVIVCGGVTATRAQLDAWSASLTQ